MLFDRVDELLGVHRLREHAPGARLARGFEPVGIQRPGVDRDGAYVLVVREVRDAIEAETRMPVRVEQGDVHDLVGVVFHIQLDDVDPVAEGPQHRLQTEQHDLVVVDERDPCACPRVHALSQRVRRPGPRRTPRCEPRSRTYRSPPSPSPERVKRRAIAPEPSFSTPGVRLPSACQSRQSVVAAGVGGEVLDS